MKMMRAVVEMINIRLGQIIKMRRHILILIRVLLGGILILYAYAKIFGDQFSKMELNENISNVEPALLVFYFFGYSQPYAFFCATAELITGLLVVIPATTRLGALLCFPFTLNIAVLDWCFGFPLSTKLLITTLTLLSLILIIADRKVYLALLFGKKCNTGI